MDNFKTLLDKGQYDLVIRLTDGAKDAESLTYRTIALVGANQLKKAEETFFPNKEKIYKYSPIVCLKTGFSLRFALSEFDQAYADYDDYSSRPYVSQTVEEYLRALPGLIRKSERDYSIAKKGLTPEEALALTKNSKDDYEILSALAYLSRAPFSSYCEEIVPLLNSDRNPSVRTYALFLLVGGKYPKEVDFLSNKGLVKVVPMALCPPFTGPKYEKYKEYLVSLAGSPSLSNVMVKLFDGYILDEYPTNVIPSSNDPTLALAVLSLAEDYLHMEEDLGALAEKYGAKRQDIETLKKLIDEDIKAEKELKF